MDMQNAKYAIYAEEDTKPKKRVLMRAFEDWEKEDVARVAEKLYSDMESGELLGHIKEANCPVVPNHLVLTDFNREIELRNKDDLRLGNAKSEIKIPEYYFEQQKTCCFFLFIPEDKAFHI